MFKEILFTAREIDCKDWSGDFNKTTAAAKALSQAIEWFVSQGAELTPFQKVSTLAGSTAYHWGALSEAEVLPKRRFKQMVREDTEPGRIKKAFHLHIPFINNIK